MSAVHDPSGNPGRDSSASEASPLLEQKEREDRARLQSFRAAAQKGFDELDPGEGVVFASPDELDSHIDKHKAAKAKSTR